MVHRPHVRKHVPLKDRHNYKIALDRRTLRTDALATFAEFLGTFLFLLLALGGTQAAATSNQASLAAAQSSNPGSGSGGSSAINTVASIEQLLYIATSFGLALLFSAWAFFRVSGSAFNPQVTLTLVICGVLSPVRGAMYVVAELVAGIAASAVLQGLVPGNIAVSPALGAGTSEAQGVFIEMFATSALCFVVLMIAVEKNRATPLAPIAIGLTLFSMHLWAVVYTGCGVNSARAFGPGVITGFSTDQWVYWVGPTLGSILASALYAFLKHVKYWQLNAGQDEVLPERSPAGPLEVLAQAVKDEDQEPKTAAEPEAAIPDNTSSTRPATAQAMTRQASAATMV